MKLLTNTLSMSLRAVCSRLKLRRQIRGFVGSHRRCYSEKPPFPDSKFLDPLLAETFVPSTGNGLKSAPPVRSRPSGPRGSRVRVPVISPASKSDLPPLSEWRQHFPNDSPLVRDRVSIRNPETALAVANAFVPPSSKHKVIIESFPGPGGLTRALLQLPKSRIRKLIVLEEYEGYLNYLRPLEALDSRLTVVPVPGFAWDSYHTIHDLGLLDDVKPMAWDAGVHAELQFISHLPSSVAGEQLVAQLFRSIPDKQWLFQYGRVPMSFLLSDYVWKRISADSQSVMRCKLSVIAEAVAQVQQALPSRILHPYEDHFHPVYNRIMPEKKVDNRRVGNPFQALNITPLEHQVIEQGLLDKWDYCLRRLFVLKSTPLKTAITSLAPGAQVLLKAITNGDLPDDQRVDTKTIVRKLDVRQWGIILKAFHEWPFAPEDLSISDSFVGKLDRN